MPEFNSASYNGTQNEIRVCKEMKLQRCFEYTWHLGYCSVVCIKYNCLFHLMEGGVAA